MPRTLKELRQSGRNVKGATEQTGHGVVVTGAISSESPMAVAPQRDAHKAERGYPLGALQKRLLLFLLYGRQSPSLGA